MATRMICSIDGCGCEVLARGWCAKHYQRWLANGDPTVARFKRSDGCGHVNSSGYLMRKEDGKAVFEHVRIAERALGRPLPIGAQVHHVDGHPGNNINENLVICPDQAYHRLLHRRLAALIASGHADYLRCAYCKKYDHPESVQRHSSKAFVHQDCYNAYKRELRTR